MNNVTDQSGNAAEDELHETANLSTTSLLQDFAVHMPTSGLQPVLNSQSSTVGKVSISHTNTPVQNMASTRNGGRNTGYNVSSNLVWKTLPRLEIKLAGVPKHFMTWDIYRLLEAYGNIIHISFQEPRGDGVRKAFVKFQWVTTISCTT